MDAALDNFRFKHTLESLNFFKYLLNLCIELYYWTKDFEHIWKNISADSRIK